MVVTPRQILSPVAQYQAEQHLLALGRHLDFGIEPLYLGEIWSFFRSGKLTSVLIATHQFIAQYRPTDDYPHSPALKALDDLLNKIIWTKPE